MLFTYDAVVGVEKEEEEEEEEEEAYVPRHTRPLRSRFEPRHEKTNVLGSYLVRHKPGCKAIEDG